jgi:hypothetical protein
MSNFFQEASPGSSGFLSGLYSTVLPSVMVLNYILTMGVLVNAPSIHQWAVIICFHAVSPFGIWASQGEVAILFILCFQA